MDVKFSVVIPAHNRSHQLLLTLTSFENQTYPKDQFEVIVVNDGSNDVTKEVVENFKAPFPLKYTSTGTRKGRSTARNFGVKNARGEYIIFCDADFLVLPNFIESFNRYHVRYENTSVSGVPESWIGVYTHLYPDFSTDTKKAARNILSYNDLWEESYEEADKIIEIITQEDVRNNLDKLKKVIAWRMSQDVKAECKRTDVAPWLLFITRCVSISKEHFDLVGGFYEGFVKYGLEDWELGYRLHRLGIQFVSIDETIGYHQEHPISYRGEDGNEENLKLIYNMHGIQDPELTIMAVCPPWSDYYRFKNTLRKLKNAIEAAEATPVVSTTTNETMDLARNQQFQIPPLQFDTKTHTPFYYWSNLPDIQLTNFNSSVVSAKNEEENCMWLNQPPYGGWGEPNGLVVYRNTFHLTAQALIKIQIPYADDMAIAYIDNNPVAYNGTIDLPAQLDKVLLEEGEHSVIVFAANVFIPIEQNRAGVHVHVVNLITREVYVTSSNPTQWLSTGYLSTLPISSYANPGNYTVDQLLINNSTGRIDQCNKWNITVH
ncbi:glycosyltransferase family 2 protein [Paenibacillus sedimenti]|uniref:Glycosyltransferase family 2 protein n=1 Tax=Paenibacillus sedimenti TaxID=2770274 RepID=A0A926KRY8_9BACL|nr:glycosyltransferase [Paenibacillus sedimenti]MBD0382218.1 glycosyltransferase family 2 protein [Paenibacillus sedimenti]